MLLNNNPSFESSSPNLQYWKTIGTAASITRSTVKSKSGSASVRFTDPTTAFSARGVVATNFSTLTITSNSNYRAGCWFFVTNEGAGAVTDSQLRISLVFLNAGYTPVSTQTNVFTNPTFNAWNYHQVVATAPNTARYAQIQIDAKETVNNNNDVFADDAEIWRVGRGSGVYVPGLYNRSAFDWDLILLNELLLDRMPPGFCKKVIAAETNMTFKIVDGGWGENWGNGFWITSYDQVWNITSGGSDAQWKNPLNKEFVTVTSPTNPQANPEGFGIMRTTAYPSHISYVSNQYRKIGHNSTVTLNMHLAYAKGSDEYVFIRWTTNSWTGSSFSLAVGSGTNYKAGIPAVFPGKYVVYYGLTSTVNPPSASPDLLTLSFKYSDGGTNFKYAVTNAGTRSTNLISPRNGETKYFSRRVKFKWQRPVDLDGDPVQNYHIWVSSNANFADAAINTDTGSTNPYYYSTALLNPNKTYYWRITSYDGFSWGPYSRTNTFIIDPPFINVDGSGSDWGTAIYNSHTNYCQISNGIWMWKDQNQNWTGANDARTCGAWDWGNCEIQDVKITADTNVLFLYLKFLNLTSGGLSYIAITIDTDQVSSSGNNGIAGNSATVVNPDAEWEKQIVATLDKTGVFDSSWVWTESGLSWFDDTTEVCEIGIPWEDLGVTLPQKIRFTISVGYKDTTDQMKDPFTDGCGPAGGSRVMDAVTRFGPNTWDEVSDGNLWHYFDITFNKQPYADDHGGHTGVVIPDHLGMTSSRPSTVAGLEFSLTNSSHSYDCGCIQCQVENGGSRVRDYNGTITHTLYPDPSGDLLRQKATGWTGGKLVEPNVILNHFGTPAVIRTHDNSITTLTNRFSISSARPNCVHINEVMFVPPGPDDSQEWVEIHSKFTNTLNLTNWYFTDNDGGGYRIKRSLIISSNNYLVLYDGSGSDDADFSDNRGALYGEWGSAVLDPDSENSLIGDQAVLYSSSNSRNTNTIIDFTGWDGNRTLSADQAADDYDAVTGTGRIWDNDASVLTSDDNIDSNYNTIGLLADSDDNNTTNDWVSRAVQTPGFPNNLHPVIQEIANDPRGEAYAEYFEIYNPLPYSVSLSNWAVCDWTAGGVSYRMVLPRVSIRSNGYLLIGRNANAFLSIFKFLPDFEWDPTGGTWTDNPQVTNLTTIGGIPAVTSDDVFALVRDATPAVTSLDVSVDIVVCGAGNSGTNSLPESRFYGTRAPSLLTTKSIRRIPEGYEGSEDDDLSRKDSDISAENNEDLANTFQQTNWDPNADRVYYVSWLKGNDAYTRFQAHHIDTPWKTVQHAHDNMVPGDMALILPGTNFESVSIMISGSPASNITYSGYSNNSYMSGKGLAAVNGFNIQANDIMVRNLKIMKYGGHGINLYRAGVARRNTIRECSIYSNKLEGIQLVNTASNLIINNSIYSNTQAGIDFYAFNAGDRNRQNTVQSNRIWRNFWYAALFRVNAGYNIGNTFLENRVFWNPNGIRCEGISTNNNFLNNTVANNDLRGIWLDGASVSRSVVRGNTIVSNNSTGVSVENYATAHSINANIFRSNYYGVYLNNGVNNSIGTNRIIWQIQDGVHLAGASTNNSVFSNTIYSNGYGTATGGIGVYLIGNSVRNNRVFDNALFNNDYGGPANLDNVKLEAPFNRVYNNRIWSDGNGKAIVITTTTSSNNHIYNNMLTTNNYGIWLQSGRKNSIRKNTITRTKTRSLYLSSATNNFIGTNYLHHTSGTAVYIEGSSRTNTVSSNYIYLNAGYGIQILNNSLRNILHNNRIYSNVQYGVDIEGGAVYNIVRSNRIFQNGWAGCHITVANFNQVFDNDIRQNTWRGITLDNNAKGNVIRNNILATNGDSGTWAGGILVAANTISNVIRNNTVYSNNPYGINFYHESATPPKFNLVFSNNVFRNATVGVRIISSSRNSFRSNLIRRNPSQGIYMTGSCTNNTFIGNSIFTNGDYGLYFTGAGVTACTMANNLFSSNLCAIRVENNGRHYIYNNQCHNNFRGVWGIGILLTASSRNRIVRNIISRSMSEGLKTETGSSYNVILSNTSSRNGIDGFSVINASTNNLIARNFSHTNANYGIYIGGAAVTTSTLVYNVCRSNLCGIRLEDIGNNSLLYNECYNSFRGTWGIGILATGSSRNRFIGNKVANSTNEGLKLETGSVDNLVSRNILSNCKGSGIGLASSDRNVIQNNICKYNYLLGIAVDLNSDNNRIFKNLVYRNGSYGININNGAVGNIIDHNTCFKNGNYGIVADQGAVIKNCITYSNSNGVGGYGGIYGNGTGPAVSYCSTNDTTGGLLVRGPGNIGTDPLFKSLTPGSEDFHLKWNSPCQFAAETNKGVQAAMGFYPVCVAASPVAGSYPARHQVAFVSTYSNYRINNGDNIFVNYSRANGSASAFRMANVTKATSQTLWATFNAPVVAGQNLRAQVNVGSTVPARTEDIVFTTITNDTESTNRVLFYIIDSTGQTNEFPEYSNDFFVGTPGDLFVNDDSVTGDIYATGAGSDLTGNGTRQKPYRNIITPIQIYTLSGGKTVWVDNGGYTNQVLLTGADSGSPGNYLNFVGAGTNSGKNSFITNRLRNNGVKFYGATNIRFMGFTVSHWKTNVNLFWNSKRILLDRNTVSRGQKVGVLVTAANTNIIRKNIICTNGSAGQNDAGIRLEGLAVGNVIFSNTIYSNDRAAITTWDANYNIISNNSIFQEREAGIYCGNFRNNRIVNNTFRFIREAAGIWNAAIMIDQTARSNIVRNNYFYTNNNPIRLYQCSNNRVENNQLYSNTGYAGIYVQYKAFGNTLKGNTVTRSANRGIEFFMTAYSNLAISNRCYRNEWGIMLENTTNIRCYVNICSTNRARGIWMLNGGVYNRIRDNVCVSNFYAGIAVNNVTRSNLIQGNYCWNNNNFGIQVLSSRNLLFKGNRVRMNPWDGLRIDSECRYISVISNTCWSNNPWSGRGISTGGYVTNILLKGNTVYNEYIGIGTYGPFVTGCTLEGNIVRHNAQAGICFGTNYMGREQRSNTFRNNQVFSNATNGIKLHRAYFNTVLSNSCFNNASGAGILIIGSPSSNNTVLGNGFYANQYGIYLDTANRNQIRGNRIFANTAEGVYLTGCSGNNVYSNSVRQNTGSYGIRVTAGSVNNRIRRNTVLSNATSSGIICLTAANNNMCASNISAFNLQGIEINNSSSVTLFGNAVYHNTRHGISLVNGDACVLYHNSVGSNDIAGNYDNLNLDAASTGNTVKNNIFAFAKTAAGYGINLLAGAGTSEMKYNAVYGNVTDNYGGNASAGSGDISSDPLWTSYNVYSTNMMFLSNASLCIDAGTNLGFSYIGSAPDMGWKEFSRSYVRLGVSKYITNVQRALVASETIPGSTLEYKIIYTLSGTKNATNIIIYDRLPPQTTYSTNRMGTASGWTVMFSTNLNPSQAYGSPDYTLTYTVRTQIRWIRWRKPFESPTATRTLFYKITIR